MTAKYWTDTNWQAMEQKPLEIYLFVDPICPECWALEPIIKKLLMEYEPYIRIKHVLSGSLSTLNLKTKKRSTLTLSQEDTIGNASRTLNEGSFWAMSPINAPLITSVAIKAAELQGKKAGSRFLKSLQEHLFIGQFDISDFHVLQTCANEANLDLEEWNQDMHSQAASKAFQCDVKIASEMDVDGTPTLVFFNENIEDEGIKIDGIYPYDVYVQIVEEMLLEKPKKRELPTIDKYLELFKVVASTEIAIVYNLSIQEAEKELKKRMFKQIVERIDAKHGTFWRYIPPAT